jgi:hypothetical protein
MTSLNLKKEIEFTKNVAVDTSVKYYKEFANAINHPTTLRQLTVYFIRLSGPLLLFFGLILIIVSFFKAMSAEKGIGMNNYVVFQNNEEVTCTQAFFQVWGIRTGQFTGTTFQLPDPATMKLGTTVTVRNVSDNLVGLSPTMAQAYSGITFVDGASRNTLTVRSPDGFTEVIGAFSNDGSTRISSTYIVAPGRFGSNVWYKAGLPYL